MESPLSNDLRSNVPAGSLRTSLILLRANTSLRERPDRLALALGAASPYRNSMLAAVAGSAQIFEFVDALPRNATGKVLRRQLIGPGARG